MNVIPIMISASDLQRSSARVMKLVDENDQVVVLNNNTPRMALVNIKKYQDMLSRIRFLEEKDALDAIKIGEEEFKLKKLKSTTDFSEFL